ncbi:E3 ubiquitin-protein ligase TRIM39-like [Pseudochaenichthys georgianus]|uniref:E3 ubiquitin-protein ligase TRIM39-like n=2 Tax=Pseudochaenichthys georgianus TaxID=52239 RepID=UPI00146F304B|nr:zinc finger protein RFP-like [Pseudochaenichthys georgianus]
MSAASCLLTEHQFLCSICLDVFTDPVSTPCGHNFCKACISQHWDTKVPYQCPNCKKLFHKRPDMLVNTFISEMAAQFRRSAQQKASSSSSEQHVVKPGEVPCDACTGTRLKALKSCLVCLESYCETHLEPHLTRAGLKKHQLIDPVENLEGRMCVKHDKLLELFCQTDQVCVCMLCTVLDHKTHDVVPLKEGCEGKKAELGKTEAETQQMIQKRRLKIQEMNRSVELSKEGADREMADGVQVFTALKESVERSQAELMDTIKEKQRETEEQAEGFIKELEQEVSELKKRSSEVEQLSRSEDQLHLLQRFTSLNAAPPTKNWTEVRVRPPSYEGTVRRAVTELEETLRKQLKKLLELKRVQRSEVELKRVQQSEVELKRVQQSEVEVTLDPDTAQPYLILSDDGKQVNDGDVRKNLPDNPERFYTCTCVLAKQSFSSGRFYHEVQVEGKTEWTLGVVRESINRKGKISLSPQDGYWVIVLRNENEYIACAGPAVRLSLKSQPQKVGVFVDYEEGLVSFYDVDAAALIYSFTGCCFKEKLYPYFSPYKNNGGKNSAPLIISPVNLTE